MGLWQEPGVFCAGVITQGTLAGAWTRCQAAASNGLWFLQAGTMHAGSGTTKQVLVPCSAGVVGVLLSMSHQKSKGGGLQAAVGGTAVAYGQTPMPLCAGVMVVGEAAVVSATSPALKDASAGLDGGVSLVRCNCVNRHGCSVRASLLQVADNIA